MVRICADDPIEHAQLGVKFGRSVADACSLLNDAKRLQLEVIGVWYEAH